MPAALTPFPTAVSISPLSRRTRRLETKTPHETPPHPGPTKVLSWARFSEKRSAVGTGYPRARRALHVEQRCSTLAPVGRLGRRKLAASLARRATIFDRISKDFAPPKPQNFLRAAPYGRGRPTAGALRARRPTARYPRSDPTYETRPLGPSRTVYATVEKLFRSSPNCSPRHRHTASPRDCCRPTVSSSKMPA